MNSRRWFTSVGWIVLLIVNVVLVFAGVPTVWTAWEVLHSSKVRFLWAQRLVLPDLAQRAVYREADRQLAPNSERTVFIGDSITTRWDLAGSFPSRSYVNRGIPGQTSTQILLRFRQDVIDLHPATVVILAGVNDLNLGLDNETVERIEENIEDMGDLALANQIHPVFATVLPVNTEVARPHPLVRTHPNEAIRTIDAWMRAYCVRHGIDLIDFASAMQMPNGELRPEYSDDGLHPNAAGYRAMSSITMSKLR